MTASGVIGLDHVVLRCPDVAATLEWYRTVLGLPIEREDEWRRGEAPFPSVRVSDTVIIDLFHAHPGDRPLDHICLVLTTSFWDSIVSSEAVEVDRGPTVVFGALGMGLSLYTRDPSGNVVELRKY